MNLTDINNESHESLCAIAKSLEIENVDRCAKRKLIHLILEAKANRNEDVFFEGTVEVFKDGWGYLRESDYNYTENENDVFVSAQMINRFAIFTGDNVSGKVKLSKKKGKKFFLVHVDSINGGNPNDNKKRQIFSEMTATYPDERLKLEIGNGGTGDLSGRIIDLIAPIGKGQRGLLVAPPKAGKTMMMQSIASSLAVNHGEVEIMVLLIDERPEEVTEMKKVIRGEVHSSTFDESPERHIHVAEMVIERAKRKAERGIDVVVLLDSITRLARAYNTVSPSSGKVLTGGVDSRALQKPKKFFGAARNFEEKGSITIIATALIDTGSKMDEVIYQEFKGTGNMELHLSSKLAEKRVFPAIKINESGTRKEELITSQSELQKMWILRKIIHPMHENEGTEFLIDRLKMSKTNSEFFESMKNKNH
jgi:transcription termination factor Rho